MYIPSIQGDYHCIVSNNLITNPSDSYKNLKLYSETLNYTPGQSCTHYDSLALVAIYNALNGPNWYYNTSPASAIPNAGNVWLNGPIDTWHGVVMDTQNCRINRLQLERLGLSGSIPNEIRYLDELETLRMFNNYLDSLPDVIAQLESLKTLSTGDNQLEYISPLIGNLKNLSYLHIRGEQHTYEYLPSNIANLRNLKELHIGCPNLKELPFAIGNLSKLEHFYLTYGQIVELPLSFELLTNLRFLNITETKLNIVPKEITELPNLEHLTLGNNEISAFSTEILKLSTLKSLSLNDNHITSIPESITQLSDLEVFQVASCPLKNLPSNIGELIKLKWIDVQSCELDSLPQSIANLNNLTLLAVSQNNLTNEILDFVSPNYHFSCGGNDMNFDGFEGFVPNHMHLTSLIYNNQNNLSMKRVNDVLFVEAGGTIGNNTYNWYEGVNYDSGTLVYTAIGDSTFTPITEGNYWSEITNAIVTNPDDVGGNLILRTDITPYTPGACSANQLNLGNTQSITCEDSILLDGGLRNMKYYIWDYEGRVVGTDTTLWANAPGRYILTIVDQCDNIAIDTIEITQTADCVWPGDFNNDNIANHYDLLAWGLAKGASGGGRSNTDTDWYGHTAPNWAANFPDGTNYKHTDANGDGLVNDSDKLAIYKNYNKIHGSVNNPNNTIGTYSIDATANNLSILNDSTSILTIDVALNGGSPNFYGTAFTVSYFGSNKEVNDVWFEFDDAWVGTEGNDVEVLYQHDPANKEIDIAITRNNQTPVVGSGQLGKVIVVEDDVDAADDSLLVFATSVKGAILNDHLGIEIPLTSSSTSQSLSNPFYGRIAFNAKVLLEGAYIYNGMMEPRLGNLIPLNQPYNIAPYNYFGSETLNSIPNNMIDWVLVEARSGVPNTAIRNTTTVERKAAILMSDGRILSTNGLSTLSFDNLNEGQAYYFVIRHRNHLDIMSSIPIIANHNIQYDFSTSTNQALGANQQKLSSDDYALMFSGDYNQDGSIQTTDFDQWKEIPALLNVYSKQDGTLDGIIQTTDYNIWYPNRSILGIGEIDY